MDDKTNRFAIYRTLPKKLFVECAIEDIVLAEIRVGKQVVTSKQSVSAKGAVLGGAVAGGVGAIIGGLGMGKSETKTMFEDIKVHVVIRNFEKNSLDIRFESMKAAQAAMDVISIAIDKADKGIGPSIRPTPSPSKPVQPESQSPVKSKIQELKELSEMLNQGLITREEFEKLKQEMLQ